MMKTKNILSVILFSCILISFSAPFVSAHSKPKSTPKLLNASWTEMTKDSISTDIQRYTYKDEQPPVVYLDNNVFHLDNCKYCSDFSKPYWIYEVVADNTRCALCIPDELYNQYIQALYFTELNNQNVLYEQKQQEIEQTERTNADYDSTQPTPDETPLPIQNNWIDNVIRETVLSVQNEHIDATPPIVYIGEYGEYHRGYCKNLGDNRGKSYWLTNVILDKIRCGECISDNTYYKYKIAAYKLSIDRYENIIKILVVVLTVFIIGVIAYFLCKNKITQSKNLT